VPSSGGEGITAITVDREVDPRRARALRARYRRILRFAGLALAQTWWFELVLPRFGLARFAARGRIRRLRRLARRFHDLAVDLGGLMIKVGQFMSSRLDVLPLEITRELEGLQDEVEPEPFALILEQAERELGIPLDRAFAHFDATPIAAASLGQAHRARLSPGIARDLGYDEVVVKVLRPGIEQIVEVDLAALRRVGQWLSRITLVSRRTDAPALVEEFATTSLHEIDYVHEAGNLERFARDFAGDARVTTPEVVWERSARRLLTLSDVTAIKITDVAGLLAAGIDPNAVAAELARATFEQIFVAGFFHADPHPGNIFVAPSPGSPGDFTLAFIDFGMMGEIDDELRDGLRQFIFAVAARDPRGWVAATQRLGVLLPTVDTVELERAITALFDRFGGMGVAELTRIDPRELEAFARQFSEVIRTLPFQLPENFLLLVRTISLTSGVTSALNRDFNMWDAVDPFARSLLNGGGAGATARSLGREGLAIASALTRLPQRLDALATRIDRGELAVRSPEVEQRLRVIDGSVRRTASAILAAGLLIAGAILRPGDEVLGTVLLVSAALPALHVIAPWRLR
jgi:predicted unusual protein kinase regulating ubiquinone biosynthesis (AarF/ABC1/UbiB family)